MNSKILIGLVVLVAGIGVGWYVLSTRNPAGQSATAEPTPTSAVTQGESAMPATNSSGVTEKEAITEKVTVSFTDTGFTPKTVTIKKGTTVTFKNDSTGDMWVASAPHPTHTDLPGFDELQSVPNGGTYNYTFEKVGTWKYHNHVAPSFSGSVTVTE